MPEPLDTGLTAVSIESEKTDNPFVGLRPYHEREGYLIFGRARDAQLLRNKLYSAPLTLFYAPSGVGKTSLLTGLVIPQLRRSEDDAAEVVYFEQWEGGSPLDDLKQAIIGLHPGADPGAPMSSLIIAARQALDCTIVLILDQFEQFLIRHPGQIDAFGRELGQAIKLANGCHVVLSLREEFLASLQPFRQHMPTLMGSTFRLEYLAGDAAREAITGPIALFDAEIDRALVDALLVDLRAETHNAADLAGLPQPDAIELPFLQLVCRRLWERSDRRRLTLALYRDVLGGRDGVIKDYVQSVVAGFSESEKDQIVEILRRLAPRSGVKKLYLVGELASEAELPEATVRRLLNHLEQHKVLRMRQTGSGTGYELYHDAFIKVLRPWVEERIAASESRARRRRRLRNVAIAFGALAVLAVVIVPLVRDRQRVEGRIETIESLPTEDRDLKAIEQWSELAAYLWGKDSNDATRELVDLLRKNQTLVPRSFVDDPGLEEVLPDASVAAQELRQRAASGEQRDLAPGSLVLAVHPERPLNVLDLFRSWRIGATRMLARSGLPAPTHVEILHDHALSERTIVLRRIGSAANKTDDWKFEFELPARPDWVLVLDNDLVAPRAQQARQMLPESERVRIERWSGAESGWYVPKWSAPLWKAAGVRVLPHEFEIVLAFRDRILHQPELVLDEESVGFLVARARSSFLRDRRRGGRRARQCGDPAAGPDRARASRRLAPWPSRPARHAGGISGRCRLSKRGSRNGRGDAPHHRHAEAARDPEGPLHRAQQLRKAEDQPCAAAATHARTAVSGRLCRHPGTPRPAAGRRPWARRSLAIGRVGRSNARGACGYLPAPWRDAGQRCTSKRYTPASWRRARPRYCCRANRLTAPDLSLSKTTDVPGRLAQEVSRRIAGALSQLVRAETVHAALGELPAPNADQLRATYSLTDLKLILRAVLQPPAAGPLPEEHTLAQMPWLLGSLIYWTRVCPPREQDCLVQGLLETQAGRLSRVVGPAARTPPAEADVRKGIEALMGLEMADALAHFDDANRRNPRVARASFVGL